MKFLHISDLHLGKRLHEQDLLPDQAYILDQVVELAQKEAVRAVLVAGDIYDRTSPPPGAVQLLDGFLTRLATARIAVLAVGGNHDCPQRLSYGSRLFASRGIHLYGGYAGELPMVSVDGEVDVYLLPFVKPAMLRNMLPEDAPLPGYDAAVRGILSGAAVDARRPSVLVAHQFVTAGGRPPELCDSDAPLVGTLGNVDGSCFDAFDYVALGHIHRAQSMGRDTLRYAGSPLPYSLSEVSHDKGCTLVEVCDKGDVRVRHLPLHPLHPLRRLRGNLDALLRAAPTQPSEDYIHAILTDPTPVPGAIDKLRRAYPNTLHLEYDNRRARRMRSPGQEGGETRERQTPAQLVEEFYYNMNGARLSVVQRQAVQSALGQGEVE